MGGKSTYSWSLHWKLFESLLLLLLSKTEASGVRAAVSGIPHLPNRKCFALNPFRREVFVCSICFSAIFSGMLSLHSGKENSDGSLPQEVDTIGMDFGQGSALYLWVGTAWWKLLNCSISVLVPAPWLDAKIAIWQQAARQAAGYCSESEQRAQGHDSGAKPGARSSNPVSNWTLEALPGSVPFSPRDGLCPGKGGLQQVALPGSWAMASGWSGMLLDHLKLKEHLAAVAVSVGALARACFHWTLAGREQNQWELLAFHSSQGQRSDSLLASAFGPSGIYFVLSFVKTGKTEGPGEQTCQEETGRVGIVGRWEGRETGPGDTANINECNDISNGWAGSYWIFSVFPKWKKNPFLRLFNSLLLPELLDLESSLMLGYWTGESTAFQEAPSPCRCSPPGVWHHLQVCYSCCWI